MRMFHWQVNFITQMLIVMYVIVLLYWVRLHISRRRVLSDLYDCDLLKQIHQDQAWYINMKSNSSPNRPSETIILSQRASYSMVLKHERLPGKSECWEQHLMLAGHHTCTNKEMYVYFSELTTKTNTMEKGKRKTYEDIIWGPAAREHRIYVQWRKSFPLLPVTEVFKRF